MDNLKVRLSNHNVAAVLLCLLLTLRRRSTNLATSAADAFQLLGGSDRRVSVLALLESAPLVCVGIFDGAQLAISRLVAEHLQVLVRLILRDPSRRPMRRNAMQPVELGLLIQLSDLLKCEGAAWLGVVGQTARLVRLNNSLLLCAEVGAHGQAA